MPWHVRGCPRRVRRRGFGRASIGRLTVMNSYRIVVRTAEKDLDQGTAWVVSERLVCTAFHVVGSCGAAKWAHELDPGRTYWLEGEDGAVSLDAAAFDARGDVALLSRQSLLDEPLALADFSRAGVKWKAFG